MPMRQLAEIVRLRLHDFHGRKRTDHHDDGYRRNDERHLVADHLRDCAHRAEQGILVSTRPAGHEHGQLGRRTHREEEQHTRVHVDRRHVEAIRQNRVRQEHRHNQRNGGKKVDDLVGRARHDVLFGERLDAVGDELAEPEHTQVRERKADPVGAIAVLDSSDRLAFHHGRNSEQQCEHEHEWNDGKKN